MIENNFNTYDLYRMNLLIIVYEITYEIAYEIAYEINYNLNLFDKMINYEKLRESWAIINTNWSALIALKLAFYVIKLYFAEYIKNEK